MRVQEVLLENNKTRYMLIDENGLPVIPVVKYLKYLDARSLSPNTQKTYCQSLKYYFTYLNEISMRYDDDDMNINVLADFVNWLRNPYSNEKVTAITPLPSKRSATTVNLIITVVTNFYDFLYRSDLVSKNMVEKLIKKIYMGNSKMYKNFLYHVSKDRPTNKNILKLKEPKNKTKVLSKEDVELLYSSATNIRDKFLIKLLFETGLRIGEALSLHIEDLKFDHNKGHKIRLKNRGELINKSSLKTGEREFYISQELMDLFDDYEYDVLDELEIDTDFVFVKLTGKNKGKPLEYHDINDIFKRLRKKTGLDVHAHLLRHTHATIFYHKTKDIKQVQERLGHSQIQTTMNLYLHPSDAEIRQEWEIAKDEFKIKGD